MDHIPFVKVTLEEAKASLQGDAAQTEPTLPPKRDWRPVRGFTVSDSQELDSHTFKWLASLPKEARPNALARQYPRIVNRVAEIWKRPLQCERYLDELMLDMRGDRQGFPPGVAAEVAALKTYFLSTSNSVHFGVWGNRIGVD